MAQGRPGVWLDDSMFLVYYVRGEHNGLLGAGSKATGNEGGSLGRRVFDQPSWSVAGGWFSLARASCCPDTKPPLFSNKHKARVNPKYGPKRLGRDGDRRYGRSFVSSSWKKLRASWIPPSNTNDFSVCIRMYELANLPRCSKPISKTSCYRTHWLRLARLDNSLIHFRSSFHGLATSRTPPSFDLSILGSPCLQTAFSASGLKWPDTREGKNETLGQNGPSRDSMLRSRIAEEENLFFFQAFLQSTLPIDGIKFLLF